MKSKLQYCKAVIKFINKEYSIDGIIKNFKNDILMFYISSNLEFKLNINDEVIIEIYDKNRGIFIYKGMISFLLENTITVKEVRFLYNDQKRKSSRIAVKFPLEVRQIYVKGGKNTINLKKPIYLLSKNLSMSGILIESNLDIPDNVVFCISIPVENKIIDVEAEIKRKYKEKESFYYGCRFQLNDQYDIYTLKKFVLKNHNAKVFNYYRI